MSYKNISMIATFENVITKLLQTTVESQMLKEKKAIYCIQLTME